MLRRSLAASAALLLAAPAARAQDLAAICRRVVRPPVGAWSEFRVIGGQGGGATLRMAVVGTETHGDTSYLWLEFAAHGFPLGQSEGGRADTLSVINRMLVPGFGPGMAEPRAHVMKFDGAPAMEMPMGRSHGERAPGANSLEDCARGKVVGWESVTVPAGTFRALHVTNADGGNDSWVVPDLPFALVKAGVGAADDSGRMELVAHGMGAKSQITETPRPYDPQLFIQMLMRQHGER